MVVGQGAGFLTTVMVVVLELVTDKAPDALLQFPVVEVALASLLLGAGTRA